MPNLICPICKEKLELKSNAYSCANNHCFDKSKSGYVNLLLSQVSKDKRHGDDKLMVLARNSFLEKGYYKPLLDLIVSLISGYAKSGCKIVDAGCGEGFYTNNIYRKLNNENKKISVTGIDISKNAIDFLAKRNKELELAVASVFNMPIADNSCDIVLSVFAPTSYSEFLRILKKDAVLIEVYPLERHLMALKEIIYDNVYTNKVQLEEHKGFELIETKELIYEIELQSNEDIRNLFMMTPYYYKTSRIDQEKLNSYDKLEVNAEFGVNIYRKL